MRLDDDDLFSLVIPTYEGTPFLRRCLEYLKSIRYPGHIVLADDSSGGHRELVESCAQRYPELWLDVHLYEHGTRFLDKLCRSLERLRARFALLCGQDDFVVPAGIEPAIQALEDDAGLACARGRVARFQLLRKEGAGGVEVAVMRHPMLAYREANAIERVLAHMRSYASTLYSVHRRSHLIESLRRTEARTGNVIFWQYLSSCLTVALGRVECTDGLFLARQAHAASWAARLTGDAEHWPLLVASPRFSAYYQGFRSALLERLRGEPGADARLGARIDAAFVDLVKLGLCRLGVEDPGDAAFHARLTAKGTPEQRQMESIARFALDHPETY